MLGDMQGENSSNLMIVNLYKNIVTGIFEEYCLLQETLFICKNSAVVKIYKTN